MKKNKSTHKQAKALLAQTDSSFTLSQVCSILFLIGLLVFYSTFQNGFFWDDKLGIIESLRVLNPSGIFTAWIPWRDVDYWPVTYNVFWMLWRVGDGSAFPFHFFLFLTHVANSIFIFLLAQQFKFKWPFAVALLFLVHPVNAETVAWSLQIKTTLSTLLALVSTFYWVRFVEFKRNRDKSLARLAFTLAVFAKTSVVTWPFVLVFATWWKRGTLNRKDIHQLLPFFIIAIIAGIVAATHNDYSSLAAEDAIRSDSFWGRLVTSGWALWFYVYKAFLPLEVTFMYPRWQTNASLLTHWLPGLAWVVLTVFAWFFRNKNDFFKAGFVFLVLYPVTLAPALGFVDIYFMKYSLVADHWQYQTLPFAIALGVSLVGMLLKRVQTIAWVFFMALTLALSSSSMEHARLFSSEEEVYQDTIKKNPGAWMAYNQLGNIASARNQFTLAEKYYQKSIELFPNHKNAINNLGKLYLKNNQAERAAEQFKRSLAINNTEAGVWADACAASAALFQFSEGKEQCLKSIELDKSNLNAHLNLGFILRRLNDNGGAVSAFEKSLEINPRSLEGAVGLGLSYLQSGLYKDAEEVAQAILRNHPENPAAKGILNEVASRKTSQ